MKAIVPVALLALATAGCATLDNTLPHTRRATAEEVAAASRLADAAAADPAIPGRHAWTNPSAGRRMGDNGWVVTITATEVAALGLGQQMELDVQAADVVYVVDYAQSEQLDAVFARTPTGLVSLGSLVPEKRDGGGRVVLRTTPTEHEQPASQPTSRPVTEEGGA